MELTHVVAAIIIHQNKFFIAKRAKGKHLEGMYEFPGGKLLKNETHEDGLKREIKEELNIDIEIKEKVGEENFRDDIINVKIHYYMCFHKSGKLTLNEHQDSAWVTKEEFKNYEFAEGDKDIISLL